MSEKPATYDAGRAVELAIKLGYTANRLAASLAEFGDDLSASAEWVQALGDAEHALDRALGLTDEQLPEIEDVAGQFDLGYTGDGKVPARSEQLPDTALAVACLQALWGVTIAGHQPGEACPYQVGHSPTEHVVFGLGVAKLDAFVAIARPPSEPKAPSEPGIEVHIIGPRLMDVEVQDAIGRLARVVYDQYADDGAKDENNV
jgi:hypothetical protein